LSDKWPGFAGTAEFDSSRETVLYKLLIALMLQHKNFELSDYLTVLRFSQCFNKGLLKGLNTVMKNREDFLTIVGHSLKENAVITDFEGKELAISFNKLCYSEAHLQNIKNRADCTDEDQRLYVEELTQLLESTTSVEITKLEIKP